MKTPFASWRCRPDHAQCAYALVGAVAIALILLLVRDLVGSRPAVAQSPYVHVVDLGTPHDFGSSEAFAIADDGHVAGVGFLEDDEPRPLHWVGSRVTTLGVASGMALDAGTDGVVVGHIVDSQGRTQAAIWEDGALTRLPPLGGDYAEALRVNSSGEVVGVSSVSSISTEQHAVLWRDGRPVDLGTLGGDSSRASAIDDAGRVAGWSTDERGLVRPFLWERGTIRRLVTPAELPQGRVLRLSPGGLAVGWLETSSDVDADRRAALFSDGQTRDLGLPKGHLSSQAYGVNDEGVVVGVARDELGRPHAVVWRDGAWRNLNELTDPDSPWVLEIAFGVNASGDVVGTGRRAGTRRAFMLRLPEYAAGAGPSTAAEAAQIPTQTPTVPPSEDAPSSAAQAGLGLPETGVADASNAIAALLGLLAVAGGLGVRRAAVTLFREG